MPLLSLHGINADNTTIRVSPGVVASKALVNGEADVVFLPPQEMDRPEVQPLLRNPDIRLVNLAQANALVRLFPALSRLVLPQGVVDLAKNIPATDVNLIASTNVVVVRKGLHPELIYLLAQTLQQVHGNAGVFQKAGDFPTQTDRNFLSLRRRVTSIGTGLRCCNATCRSGRSAMPSAQRRYWLPP